MPVAAPKSPKLTTWERKHRANIRGYERQVESLFDKIIAEAARLGASVPGFNPEDEGLFSFDAYPSLRRRVGDLFGAMNKNLYGIIVNGIDAEWTLANNKNNELSRQVFGENIGKLSQAQYRRYFSTNDAAREAFIARKEAGLNLSDRVWRYTGQFKREIELGLDVGLRNGQSAVDMTRDLRRWLRNPDALFRRVRDEHGNLQLSQAAKAYHPGQGVYRSAFKNAKRLAATETNIAYRTSDYERWQQLDFVVGIEIRLSNNHTLLNSKGIPAPFYDICDELAGRYPKDFKFSGWHPNCRCHAVSILKTEEELAEDTRRILNGEELTGQSVNREKNLPRQYTEWAERNEHRFATSTNPPIFLQENKGLMGGEYLEQAVREVMTKAIRSGDEIQALAEDVASKYGGRVTPLNLKSRESIIRKVLAERIENPTYSPFSLGDSVRTTIIADKKQIEGICQELKNAENYIRSKVQNTSLGYTGYLFNFTTASGIKGEIQVNTPRMMYAKMPPREAKKMIGESLWEKIHKETGLKGGLGHKYYELWRVLDPLSPEAMAIAKKSREYYSHFTS